jgi:hypothetical protein
MCCGVATDIKDFEMDQFVQGNSTETKVHRWRDERLPEGPRFAANR